MKHWTDKFFVKNPDLWLHFLDRGWKRNKLTVSAITRILWKHDITKGRLLEVACGNGRICIPMAKKGFRVTGIDISMLYIRDAKRRAIKNHVKADFVCGDMRRLDRMIRDKYDVVLSVWTSIGYYNKRTDDKLFRNVAGLMKKNGLFLILNTMSQEYLMNHYCTSLYNETDKFVVLHRGNEFDRFHSINKETWVFYEKEGKNLKYVDEFPLSLRIYSLAEIVEMAERAGLEFVEAYDNLRTLVPARPDSVINVVFRRK